MVPGVQRLRSFLGQLPDLVDLLDAFAKLRYEVANDRDLKLPLSRICLQALPQKLGSMGNLAVLFLNKSILLVNISSS